jgi:hypothetical protein
MTNRYWDSLSFEEQEKMRVADPEEYERFQQYQQEKEER